MYLVKLSMWNVIYIQSKIKCLFELQLFCLIAPHEFKSSWQQFSAQLLLFLLQQSTPLSGSWSLILVFHETSCIVIKVETFSVTKNSIIISLFTIFVCIMSCSGYWWPLVVIVPSSSLYPDWRFWTCLLEYWFLFSWRSMICAQMCVHCRVVSCCEDFVGHSKPAWMENSLVNVCFILFLKFFWQLAIFFSENSEFGLWYYFWWKLCGMA
jgi:hypothetical protein